MLKLKRSPGQSIMIGDDLKITLERISQTDVAVSINEREVTISRGGSHKISDDIAIHILAILPNMISIGIHAPKKIPIFRDEIYKRIQRRKADSP